MIDRLRDILAPPKREGSGEMGYRRLLRWAALPVTDRRWAAPLLAVALGFGLFVGVAIGPGARDTFATGAAQIIEIPSFDRGADDRGGGGGGVAPAAAAAPVSSGSLVGGEESAPAFASAATPEEFAAEPEASEEPTGQAAVPKAEEEPVQPEEQELLGTVVHVNPAASSYTVAETGGVMNAVHAGKLPAAGAAIEVPIRALANGTLAEVGKRHKTGSDARATLAGIVTFVVADPAAPAYTVSNRGTSVLVHVQPDPTGLPPALPALGAYVTVAVGIETGLLWQRELAGSGAPFTHSDFEGIVATVDAEASQLAISADDVRESAQDIVFVVPPEIDLTGVTIGDSVVVAADIGADGSPALTGLASDERLAGADDTNATQGDLVPEKPKGEQ